MPADVDIVVFDEDKLIGEARVPHQLGDFLQRVLVAAFGPDCLARFECDNTPASPDVHYLTPLRSQMHLDAVGRFVEADMMLELAKIEVGFQFPVNPSKQVQIERRRYPQRIVVSFHQAIDGFQEIGTEQERIARHENASHFAQEMHIGVRFEIADRAA